VIKKRASSNIKAAAKKHEVHGLGLTPLIDEAYATMGHLHETTELSDPNAFPQGPQSAMPEPLNVRSPSMDTLPADQTLDGLLALHLHLDQSTNAIHRFIDYRFDKTLEDVEVKHLETVKIVNDSFASVIDRVEKAEGRFDVFTNDFDVFKLEVSEKMMDLAKVLQEKVLDKMGDLATSNAQLDSSVSHLITRVIALEKKQKEMIEMLKSVDAAPPGSMSLPRVLPLPTDPSPAPSHTPPLHSYSGQNYSGFNMANGYGSVHSSASAYPYYMDYSGQGAAGYPAAQWGGSHVSSNVGKMNKGERAQYLSNYGDRDVGNQVHPAYRNGGNGSESC
jgi:hypothetical protein